MPKIANSWFTRKGAIVSGPFTAGLIRRYVLLGRVNPDDEASCDKIEWRQIQEIPDLFPDIMHANLSDPGARERLLAAQRWADERTVKERRAARQGEAIGPYQRGKDRRGEEEPGLVDYRETRSAWDSSRSATVVVSNRKFLTIVTLIVIVLLAISGYFLPAPAPDDSPNCAAAAAAGINWSNCQLEGKSLSGAQLQKANVRSANLAGANLQESNLSAADFSFTQLNLANLSGANLSNAILLGAGFRSANLQNSNLSSANLSYADLRGANLEGATLTGAKLDKAIWPDGTVCAPGSVGQCMPMVNIAE